MALGSSPCGVWGPRTAPCQFSCALGWGQGWGRWGGSAFAPGALRPGLITATWGPDPCVDAGWEALLAAGPDAVSSPHTPVFPAQLAFSGVAPALCAGLSRPLPPRGTCVRTLSEYGR